MAIPDPASAKQALRRLIRGMTPDPVPGGTSAAIVKRILGYLDGNQLAGPLSLFAPRRDEPDLLELFRSQPDACRLFPRVAGNQIVLHSIDDLESLKPGAFRILEPPAETPVVAPENVRVFLCPGVAFDTAGRRLGRGGCYYDRLLARRSTGSLVIGVCCEQQIVAGMPFEAHDARMDLVVTERRTLRNT